MSMSGGVRWAVEGFARRRHLHRSCCYSKVFIALVGFLHFGAGDNSSTCGDSSACSRDGWEPSCNGPFKFAGGAAGGAGVRVVLAMDAYSLRVVPSGHGVLLPEAPPCILVTVAVEALLHHHHEHVIDDGHRTPEGAPDVVAVAVTPPHCFVRRDGAPWNVTLVGMSSGAVYTAHLLYGGHPSRWAPGDGVPRGGGSGTGCSVARVAVAAAAEATPVPLQALPAVTFINVSGIITPRGPWSGLSCKGRGDGVRFKFDASSGHSLCAFAFLAVSAWAHGAVAAGVGELTCWPDGSTTHVHPSGIAAGTAFGVIGVLRDARGELVAPSVSCLAVEAEDDGSSYLAAVPDYASRAAFSVMSGFPLPPIAGLVQREQVLPPVPRCPVHFAIATLAVGAEDPRNMNALVFEHIAQVLAENLRFLGHNTTLVACASLKDCAAGVAYPAGAQLIIVGSCTIANLRAGGGVPVVLLLPDELVPNDTVLYQWEMMNVPIGTESWVTSEFVAVHQRYPVWEHARCSLERLLDLGVQHAVYVPTGFGPSLRGSGAAPVESKRDVDLLFIGNFSPYRQRALDRLYVESGVYPSWRRGFGEALIANVRRAKIVVNMRNHDVPCEVKMARLMVLLSQHTFVVSERLGMPETEEHFSRGIVFVDSEDLAPTIVFYLRRPALRESIARSGFELFSAMPQWAALAEPVRAIEHARGCGA